MRFRELPSRLLACLLVAALAAGCAPQAVLQARQLPPPQSVEDLLVNMRRVTKSRLVLEEDFYAEDTLERVFGGRSVRYAFHTPDRTDAVMGDFPAWAPRQDAGNPADDALGLRLLLQPERNLQAAIVLRVGDKATGAPDFDAIERLFGTGWVSLPPLPPSPDRPQPVAPTRPHGNARIEYLLGKGLPKRILSLEFGPDATLTSATASVFQP